MSSDPPAMETILAMITQLRLMSANFVMFSQAQADVAGMNPTDLEVLDHLDRDGPMTAGKLSEVTGLTTGTMTALIDRLERAGYARRERSEKDRRQVIVVPNREKIATDLAPITEAMARASIALLQSFTDEELQLLLRFGREANAMAQREIAALRARKSSA